MATPLDSAIFKPLFTDEEIAALLSDAALRSRAGRSRDRVGTGRSARGRNSGEGGGTDRKSQRGKVELAALTQGTRALRLSDHCSGPRATETGWRRCGAVYSLGRDDAGHHGHSLRVPVALRDQKSCRTRLGEIARHLSELADRHRDTVLAGRTHGQQALPITFGLKVASWLAPLVRHAERLDEISPRLFVVQFGGAAGTLAALGDKGLRGGAGARRRNSSSRCPRCPGMRSATTSPSLPAG